MCIRDRIYAGHVNRPAGKPGVKMPLLKGKSVSIVAAAVGNRDAVGLSVQHVFAANARMKPLGVEAKAGGHAVNDIIGPPGNAHICLLYTSRCV